MADVQVTLSLPVLRQGSNPESGPTVIEHLQLMLNERGGFPIVNVDGDFGPSTGQSVEHYQQNENLTVDGIVGKTDLDIPPVQMAVAVGTRLNG
jgi:peptidoglycan hydrolase-like protein with peptidoglycan-binding domain